MWIEIEFETVTEFVKRKVLGGGHRLHWSHQSFYHSYCCYGNRQGPSSLMQHKMNQRP